MTEEELEGEVPSQKTAEETEATNAGYTPEQVRRIRERLMRRGELNEIERR